MSLACVLRISCATQNYLLSFYLPCFKASDYEKQSFMVADISHWDMLA